MTPSAYMMPSSPGAAQYQMETEKTLLTTGHISTTLR